jgi:hypothetical protein
MRIRQILTLPILALALVDPPPLLSVAQAAQITAPGLHVKAFKAEFDKLPESLITMPEPGVANGNTKTSPFWPSDPVLCDLVLDGEVAEGDAASLKQNFETIAGTMVSFTFFLCLRSPGGDTGEAVKIAQFVLSTQRPSIGTVIEDGQTCSSACAIIFLAGNAPARVGGWPQRFLHPRGKLLYHSTHVDLTKFSDDNLLAYLTDPSDPGGLKGRILDLYSKGLRDEQSVIATFQNFIFEREDLGDRWVRPSLFLEMFAQGPDEWICVDNVDAVGRWNIQVYGYRPPNAPTKQNYSNVCRSAYDWRSDQFAAGKEDDLDEEGRLNRPLASTAFAGRNKGNVEFDERFTMSFQARLFPVTCVVEPNTPITGKNSWMPNLH